MEYTIQKLNQFIKEYDGNHSIMFPIIKDKFDRELAGNPKTFLHEGEEDMFYEFAFFEYDYFLIKRDIILNNLNKMKVVDIGCQLGLQSELFLDMNYIGIECCEKAFLNENKENILYVRDTFPTNKISINDSIVISNMSLGFFPGYIDENFKIDMNYHTNIYDVDIKAIKELAKAKILYCNSRPAFIEELKKYFNYCEFLEPNNSKIESFQDVSRGVYKFYN